MKNCKCSKWACNIEILNAPYMLKQSAIGEYSGDDFEYCPWCGNPLMEDINIDGFDIYDKTSDALTVDRFGNVKIAKND